MANLSFENAWSDDLLPRQMDTYARFFYASHAKQMESQERVNKKAEEKAMSIEMA